MLLIEEAREYIEDHMHSALDEHETLDSMIRIRECDRIVCRLLQVMAWVMAERAIHNQEALRDDQSAQRCAISAQETCLMDAVPDGITNSDPIFSLLMRSRDLYIRAMRISTQSCNIHETLPLYEQLSPS